ncbi:MAG: hypothetical protein ACLFV7_10415 [Phycisphaerae bacterium]
MTIAGCLSATACALDCAGASWSKADRARIAEHLVGWARRLAMQQRPARAEQALLRARQPLSGFAGKHDAKLAVLRAGQGLAAIAVQRARPGAAAELADARTIARRSVRRFLQSAFGDAGAPTGQHGLTETLQIVALYVLAEKQLSGEDLAAGTGAKSLARWGLVTRGVGIDGRLTREDPRWLAPAAMLADGRWARTCLQQMSEDKQRATGLRDARLRLLAGMHHPTVAKGNRGPASAAGEARPAAAMDRDMGVVVFRGGKDGADFLTTFHAASGPIDAAELRGHFTLSGLGRHWVRPVGNAEPLSWPNVRRANALQVYESLLTERKGVRPLGAGHLRRVRAFDGGTGGSVSMLAHGFAEVDGKKRNREVDDPASLWRTVGVDTSKRSGAEMLLVTVGGAVGLKDRRRVWEIDVGDVPADRVQIDGRRFTIRPADSNATMTGTMVYPPTGHLSYLPPHDGTGGRIRCAMTPPGKTNDQMLEDSMADKLAEVRRLAEGVHWEDGDATSIEIEAAFNLPKDEPQSRQLQKDAQAILNKLFRQTSSVKMGGGDRFPKAVNSCVMVLTVQEGNAPTVTVADKNAQELLRVGDVPVRYREYLLTFESDNPSAPEEALKSRRVADRGAVNAPSKDADTPGPVQRPKATDSSDARPAPEDGVPAAGSQVAEKALDAPAAMEGRVRLTLPGALKFQTHRRTRDPWKDVQDLQLDLVCRDGQWQAAAWGFSKYIPAQEHLGRVVESSVTGDGGATLRIAMTINPNRHSPCVLGGPADIRLTLAADANGHVTGSYTLDSKDTHNRRVAETLEERWGFGREPGGKPWSQPTLANRLVGHLQTATTRGKPDGRVRPHVKRRKGRTPFDPGLHPRLLFDKGDLDRLRSRAKTPQGRKIVAELKDMLERAEKYGYGFRYPQAEHTMGPMWATGWGLLYQLTGEEQYARKAADQFRGPMYGSYYYGGWWIHPYAVMGTAVTYDLCADAWSPERRELVYGYLEKNIRDLAGRHDLDDLLGTSGRYHFANDQHDFQVDSAAHTKTAKFRAAAAIAALALLGDTPPIYQPPQMDRVRRIAPARGFAPSVGVPVVTLESDKMFRRWLVNGPFLRGTQEKYVAKLGGWSNLRPRPGEAVEVDGETLEFRLYLPTGHTDRNGPTIYARNCARYWTGATGGGHWPGIRLVRNWKEQLGRRPGINVVLYTVLKNDRERVIQALPNWRSRNEGSRMWINGSEVTDGELVRLSPGLYPVVVDVPVMGGYSAQAPKMREYTPRMHAADTARAARARSAYAGSTVFDNEMLRSFVTLRRSVMRYLRREVSEDGWGGWETHETVLPLLLAMRTALGEDSAAGTGLEKLMPLAARLRGHYETRACDTMVSQGTFLMTPQDRSIAAWYMDRHGRRLRRPMDAIIALASHPLDAKPVSPAGNYPLAKLHPRGGVLAMAGAWAGESARFAMLHAGSDAPNESIYLAGHLRLQAFGHTFACTRWDTRHPQQGYDDLNNLSVRKLLPARAGKVSGVWTEADGSGGMTVTIDRLREVEGWDNHGRARLSKKDSGVTLQRSVAVDYHGRSGSPMTVVVVDKVSGAGRRQKTWRMDLGGVFTGTAYNRRKPTLVLKGKTVTAYPKDTDAVMSLRFLSPEKVELREVEVHKGTAIEATLHRHLSRTERLKKDRLGESTDDLLRKTNHTDSTDLHGEGPSPDATSRFGPGETTALGGDTGGSLDEMDDALRRKRTEHERTLPPVYFVAVITIGPGEETPAVRMDGQKDSRTITVGKQTFVYDGKSLRRAGDDR